MRKFTSCASKAAGWATLALLLPQAFVHGEPFRLAPPPVNDKSIHGADPSSTKVYDIILTADGRLQGQVVDGQGNSIPNTRVNVTQNGQPLAQTFSNSNGQFSVPNLNNGLYGINSNDASQAIRAWTPESAPPQALPSSTLVNNGLPLGQSPYSSPISQGFEPGLNPEATFGPEPGFGSPLGLGSAFSSSTGALFTSAALAGSIAVSSVAIVQVHNANVSKHKVHTP